MENYIGKICPFCKTEIKEGDSVKVCPACGIPHHESCWEQNHGCTTLGCSEQHCNEQHTNTVDVCQNCGAPLCDGQEFCHKCGAKVNILLSAADDPRNRQSENPASDKDSSQKAINKKPTLKALIGIGILAIVVVAAYVFPKVILPQINLSKARSAFDSANYIAAVDYYEKSNFQDNEENIGQYTYALAMKQFEASSYSEAAENFEKAGNLLDSESKIFDCGVALVESEDYSNAAACFAMLKSDDAQAYKNYCDGMVSYNKKDYSEAISKLEKAEPVVKSVSELIPQMYYEYGKSLFDKKDYSGAAAKFEKAGDYSDANTYVIACALMEAEDLLSKGYFSKAADAYDKLPQDFDFNGISVSQRLSSINSASAFSAISGKWTATKNYIESRNVYRRTGSWDNWYIDETLKNQSLEIHCYLNADGTVTLKGSVSFYRFTDYSSLSAYCNATQTTKSFTIDSVRSIPTSYAIDDNTTLKYANGNFSISYSVRDNYSSYFYNLYNSSVTFGKRTETY